MRGRIIMYLFIFALLSAIFIYINDKKVLDAKNEQISNLEYILNEVKRERDSLNNLSSGENYFSLEGNEEALTYLETKGYSEAEINEAIEDKLISANASQQDNSYVPFEGMEGNMRINKIKLLNHKWALADFTDGTYWGEIFFSYYIEENGEISLNAEKSFLYSVN